MVAPTAKAEAVSAKVLVSHSETLIARLKLEIERSAETFTVVARSARRGFSKLTLAKTSSRRR